MTTTMEIGDHIYRAGSTPGADYTHHGIVVGTNEVIHFYKPKGEKKHVVRSTGIEKFSDGKPVEIKSYVRIVEEMEELTGEAIPPDTAGDIRANVADVAGTIRRARELLGKHGYGFLTKNCEHLAVYCKTGRHFSHQVSIFEKLLQNLFIRDPNGGAF